MIGTLAPSTMPAESAPPEKVICLASMLPASRIRNNQNIGLPGDRGDDAFLTRRIRADRVIKHQRSVAHSAPDLATIGHLTKRGGVDRRLHACRHSFDCCKHRNLGPADAQRNREVDRILHDINLAPGSGTILMAQSERISGLPEVGNSIT